MYEGRDFGNTHISIELNDNINEISYNTKQRRMIYEWEFRQFPTKVRTCNGVLYVNWISNY